MVPFIDSIWKEAAVAAILIVILYAGLKGQWYWRSGVHLLVAEIRKQRDDWRTLAVTLLRKQGIELPEDFDKSDLTIKK